MLHHLSSCLCFIIVHNPEETVGLDCTSDRSWSNWPNWPNAQVALWRRFVRTPPGFSEVRWMVKTSQMSQKVGPNFIEFRAVLSQCGDTNRWAIVAKKELDSEFLQKFRTSPDGTTLVRSSLSPHRFVESLAPRFAVCYRIGWNDVKRAEDKFWVGLLI